MVKHSQLIICVKAILVFYLVLFLFPLLLQSERCMGFSSWPQTVAPGPFEQRGRRRLKGMLIASLLTEVWLLGLRDSFETVQVRMTPFFLVVLDRVPQAVLSEASAGPVSLPVGAAFKLNFCSSAPAWATSHLTSLTTAMCGHALC